MPCSVRVVSALSRRLSWALMTAPTSVTLSCRVLSTASRRVMVALSWSMGLATTAKAPMMVERASRTIPTVSASIPHAPFSLVSCL